MDHARALTLTTALTLTLVLPGLSTSATESCADDPHSGRSGAGSPDHDPSGNRVLFPCQGFVGTWKELPLERTAAWVLAHPSRPGEAWIVVDEQGTAVELDARGTRSLGTGLEPGAAPRASWQDGELALSSRSEPAMTGDPVPHGRPVTNGRSGAALAGPTDRYAHGVLGDDLEASALDIWRELEPGRVRVELAPNEVVEGIAAIAAVLTDDGAAGFLVTVSDAQQGARLRAYDEHGAVIGESEPIGRGFRWLHQIGVGPAGPGGEIEVIAVRTPHIGGVLEAYRLSGHRFERRAAIEGYSSHVIGSANLDMALLADTDRDGQLEVVVPTQSMTELAVLERTADGFAQLLRLPLDGVLASNVAAAVDADGHLSLAAATIDGRLRVFR